MAKDVRSTVEKKYPEFVNEVAGMPLAELEKRLSTYAKQVERVNTDLEDNQKIASARELLSELLGPYRDTKKALRLKTKYVIELIKERGGDV
jgi:hypothetical protein